MQRCLVCLLVLVHLTSPLPVHNNDYNYIGEYAGGETTESGMLATTRYADMDIESTDSAYKEASNDSFSVPTDEGIDVMDETTKNEGEQGTGEAIRTEDQTIQEEIQEVTEAVPTNMDNEATNGTLTIDVQTEANTDTASNQATKVVEIEEQVTKVHSTGDITEAEPVKMAIAEEDYETSRNPQRGKLMEEVVEDTTEAVAPIDMEATAALETESFTSDAFEEGLKATADDHTEEDDAEGGSIESRTELVSTLNGGPPRESAYSSTATAEEGDYTMDEHTMEVVTTGEKSEESTETPADIDTDTDVLPTDASSLEDLLVDYAVSTTDALRDEVTVNTDDLTDVLVKKDEVTTMAMDEDYTTEPYSLEGEVTEEGIEGTTEALIPTEMIFTDLAEDTVAQEDDHTTDEQPMDVVTTEEKVKESTEALGDIDTDTDVLPTDASSLEDLLVDYAVITTDALRDEATVKTDNLTDVLVKKDEVTTMAMDEDYTTEPYSLEGEVTEEGIEGTTEALIPTEMIFTDLAEDTVAQEDDHTTDEQPMDVVTTEEKVKESTEALGDIDTDTDVLPTDASSLEDLLVDYAISTTDALRDEATVKTDNLTDVLVKKDEVTTMAMDEDYTTEPYSLEGEVTEEGIEGTTEALIATDFGPAGALVTEIYVSDAGKNELEAATDIEEEETTEVISNVEDGLNSERMDSISIAAPEEDHTTEAYPFEAEKTDAVIVWPAPTNVTYTDAVGGERMASDADKEEGEATTDSLAIVETTETDMQEGTIESDGPQSGGLYSESVETMTTVHEEEIYTEKAYLLGTVTTAKVAEETSTSAPVTDAEPTNAVIANHLVTDFVFGTADTIGEASDASDDTSEMFAKRDIDESALEDENQPTETTSPSEIGSPSANLNATATAIQEEKYPATVTTAVAKGIMGTTETTTDYKFLDGHVFTGLWSIDNGDEKGDETETPTTVGTDDIGSSYAYTPQASEAVTKATTTEVAAVAEHVAPVTEAPRTGMESSGEATNVVEETTQAINSALLINKGAEEDVATTGENPDSLSGRPLDDEQGPTSEFVTVGTPTANPGADSSTTEPTSPGTEASSTSKDASEGAPATLLEVKPDDVMAAASFGMSTSAASSIRSGLSLSLILLLFTSSVCKTW